MIEIPGYAIKREISSDEVALVCVALQTSLDREVAIKALLPAISADPAAAQHFQQQARQLASLSHPNIVSIYDVGATTQELSYFSMQYLPGGDFAAHVNRGIKDADLTETLAAIARALGYIHQRGLLHRALAPRKVLYDGNGTPVLTYFGGSVPVSDSHLTNTGFAIGNSHYMSPEQARGGEVNERSDIYALGALSYYGIVGRPPYDGVDGFAVAYAHVFEPIPRLPADKAHWQPLIDGALAKDPKDRYANAEEFLDALTGVALDFAAARSDAIPAPSPSPSIARQASPAPAKMPEKAKPLAETVAAPLPIIAAPATAPARVPPPVPPTVPSPAPARVSAATSVAAVPKSAPIVASPSPPPPAARSTAPATVVAAKLPTPEMLTPVQAARIDPIRPPLPATVVPASTPSRAVVDESSSVAIPMSLQPPKSPSKVKRDSTARQWISVLALLVVVIGLCAIGYTVLNNYVRHPQVTRNVVVETAKNAEGIKPVADPVTTPATTTTTLANPSTTVIAPVDPVPATTMVAPTDSSVVKLPTDAGAGAISDVSTTAADIAETALPGENFDLSKIPTVVDPLPESIRLGRIEFAGQRLTTPPGANALERFQYALKLDPKSKGAIQGLVDIAKKYTEYADKAASGGDQVQFAQFLERAESVAKLVPEGQDVAKAVAQRRQKAAEPFIAQGKAAAATWDKAGAQSAYEKALQIDPNNTVARDAIKFVATIGEPGFAFHDDLADGGHAPELVILGGARLAMGQRDVTRGEFRKFWNAAGRAQFSGKEPNCRDRESIFRSSKKRNWENPDITQDDSHPVVCIGWAQAVSYAQWLSKQTGKHYRLLNTAEFDQVAAKAAAPDCKTANIADASFNHQFDSRAGAACDDGFAATSPAGHFAPVSPGIYDIDGNVRTWVAACGNGAPAQPGSACRDFLVKGRGWLSVPGKEAATISDTYAADVALNSVGMRIVRDLDK